MELFENQILPLPLEAASHVQGILVHPHFHHPHHRPHLPHLPHPRLLLPHLRQVHLRSSSPVRLTPLPAPRLHLHLHHPPLHHLHEASTTTHPCRSPLGRTQAQVQALECRSGARHKAQRHLTWNGPLLILQLLNLPPRHLLHRRPLPLLGLLSPPLQLLSDQEAPRHSQQQREEQQQQQNKQQQRKKQPQQKKLQQRKKQTTTEEETTTTGGSSAFTATEGGTTTTTE